MKQKLSSVVKPTHFISPTVFPGYLPKLFLYLIVLIFLKLFYPTSIYLSASPALATAPLTSIHT